MAQIITSPTDDTVAIPSLNSLQNGTFSRLQADLDIMVQKEGDAADPDLRSFYRHLRKLMEYNAQCFRKPLSQVAMERESGLRSIPIIRQAVKSFGKLDDEAKRYVLTAVRGFYCIELTSAEMAVAEREGLTPVFRDMVKEHSRSLTPYDMHAVFQAIHLLNVPDEFEQAVASELPSVQMRRAYKSWKKNNRALIEECAARNGVAGMSAEPVAEAPAFQDEASPLPPSPPEIVVPEDDGLVPDKPTVDPDGVTHINVHHPLLIWDEPDDMGDPPDRDSPDHEEGHHEEVQDQQRTDVLVRALLADNVEGRNITVLHDRRPLDPARSRNRPYNIVDVRSPEFHGQIAVCDWKGFATFVLRDPGEVGKHDSLHIKDLRDDPKVWRVSHVNQSQWLAQIQEYLYTPLEKLTPQVKHRSYWQHKKEALIDSFIAHIMNKGALPGKHDNAPIAYGMLKGKTTFARASDALRREHIEGLEGVRNFDRLYDKLVKDMPDLPSFIDQPPLHASTVLSACRQFTAEFDLAPQEEFYDSFSIAGLKPGTVCQAFRHGAIQGLEEFLPPGAGVPRKLEDFVVQSGLARRCSNGELVPRQLARPDI